MHRNVAFGGVDGHACGGVNRQAAWVIMLVRNTPLHQRGRIARHIANFHVFVRPLDRSEGARHTWLMWRMPRPGC